MAQRVLGLDIGRSSIKGVVLETSARTFELAAFHTEPIAVSPEADEETKEAAVQTALFHLMENIGEVDQILTALPGDVGASSVLDMPFSDPGKIEQILPIQMEDLTPFDVGDLVIDYQFIDRSKGKGPSKLLVGSVPKESIESFLNNLQEAQIDPRILMADGLPYAHLFDKVTDLPNVSMWGVVDLGEEQTTLTIFQSNPEDDSVPFRAVLVRSLARGTHHLRTAMAQMLGIDTERAEELILQHLNLSTQQASPNPQVSEAVTRALTPTILELRRTLAAAERKLEGPIEQLFLTGGGALLTGIEPFLSQRLSIPSQRLHINSLPISDELEWPQSNDTYLKALALALRSIDNRNVYAKLDFRQGEFGYKGNLQFLKDRLGSLMLMAAILAFLLGVSVFSSFYVRGVEGTRLEKEIQKRCFQIIGRRGLSPHRCLGIMDDEIQKVSGKGGRSLVPRTSSYDLLLIFYQRMSDLSKNKRIKVEINSLRITSKRFDFEGETSSFEAVDKIEQQLKAYKCFSLIKKGKVQRSSGKGSKVEFRLSAVLSC